MVNIDVLSLTNCDKCPLQKDIIYSPGPISADIALVGDAPDWYDVKQRRLFSGRSGVMLDVALNKVGLHRGSIREHNTLLCQPVDASGDMMSPPLDAVRACSPRLIAEIKAGSPKVVVSLGAVPSRELFQFQTQGLKLRQAELGIAKMDGMIFWSDVLDCYVISTYHPSHVVKGQHWAFDNIVEALQRAVGVVNGETPIDISDFEYTYLSDPSLIGPTLDSVANSPGRWALDTETPTLIDPEYRLITIQLSDENVNLVFDAQAILQNPVLKSKFVSLLESDNHVWMMHNASFDIKYLVHNFYVAPKHYEDTMAMALCLYERASDVGLKKLSRTLFNAPMYEQDIHSHMTESGSSFSDVPVNALARYGALDTHYTYLLYKKLEKGIFEGGFEKLYNEYLKPAQKLFARLEYEGIRVDGDYIRQVKKEWSPKIEELKEEIAEFAFHTGFRASAVVKKPKSERLNAGSPKQLAHLLFDILGYEPPDGVRTTGAAFLEKYPDEHITDLLYNYRRMAKMMSSYIVGTEKHVWEDGRVHPSFALWGTVTGRRVIHDPPLQTIPRDDFIEGSFASIKRMFLPDYGHLWFEADYSSLELWMAYHYSKDPNLLTALKGGDIHTYTASRMFNVSEDAVNGVQRTAAKGVSFGTLYGIGPQTLSTHLKCSLQEASDHIDNFFRTYPLLKRYVDQMRHEVIETGEVSSSIGRKRRWSLITPDTMNEIGNQAVNMPSQSLGADMTLRALIDLDAALRKEGLGRCFFDVHDSICGQIVKGKEETAKAMIVDIMCSPRFETDAEFHVDIKTGETWGDAK